MGTWRQAHGDATPGALARAALLVVVVAAGLAAIQLAPTAVLARESIRWKPSQAFLSVDTLPVGNLITFLIPLAFHGTSRWISVDEFHGYLGIFPLALAAWALGRPWNRWTCGFAAMAVLGLLIALGLPPFMWVGSGGAFRAPARAVYLVDLGIAALAGLGADALLRAPGAASARARCVRAGVRATAAAAVAGGLWLAARGVPPPLQEGLSPGFAVQYRACLQLLLGTLVALELVWRFPSKPLLARGAMVALLMFEIFSFPREIAWPLIPPERRWRAREELTALTQDLGASRLLQERTLFSGSKSEEANAGLVYRVPSTSIYTSLPLQRYGRLMESLAPGGLPRSRHVYDAMAVRYVVSETDVAALSSLPHDASGRGIERVTNIAWVVRDGLVRAYLAGGVRELGSKHEVLRMLGSQDPRQVVLLEGPWRPCPREASRPGSPGEVLFLADEPDRVTLRVRAAEAGPLVLSDAYYPGWRVTVDGVPTPIYRANFFFRAVCVPAGEHIVEFTFRQRAFSLGLALTTLTGIGTVLLLWRSSAPARTRQTDAPPDAA